MNNLRLTFGSRNRTLVAIGVLVVAVLAIWFFLSKNTSDNEERWTVGLRTVIQKVKVTGKVAPLQKADLGFESSGTLVAKYFNVGDTVKAGDTIASLDIGGSYASLLEAEASLASEKAKLDDLSKGLRSEEYSVEETKVRNAETAYSDAEKSLENAVRDAYTKTTSAILNYTDQFYQNPQTVVPAINIRVEGTVIRDRANDSRVLLTDTFYTWKNKIDTSSDVTTLISASKKSLDITKSFLGTITSIVSVISVGNSGVTQATIDGYNSTLNSAYVQFNSALSAITTAETNLKTASSTLSLAVDQFNFKKAGTTPEALAVQRARVDQASASVLAARSIVGKANIISPVNGIVTRADSEVGEFVPAGKITFGVMSGKSFKIEVYVPEMDIAKISVGNTASITLDAYGSGAVFPASVVLIDPAETMVEGVPTYRVTLKFENNDERIRSGMTANIDIVTADKAGVIAVPISAVSEVNGQKIVHVDLGSGNIVERNVTVGVRGSEGYLEIVGGLSSGDNIIISTK